MGSAGKWDRPVSGIGLLSGTGGGLQEQADDRGARVLADDARERPGKSPAHSDGRGWYADSKACGAQVDALDVSGNSLLDDSIPYFVEVRGWGGVRRQAHVRACAQVCLRARTHVRACDPARAGPHERFGPRVASLG